VASDQEKDGADLRLQYSLRLLDINKLSKVGELNPEPK
jgi:hypothetical protein